MDSTRVLVAFSSRHGSTAGAARQIAAVLRAAGLSVDCRPKEDVADVTPYRAVVLGSGVFVASRASDGGGFLERHRASLAARDVWLFSTGPLGAHGGRSQSAPDEAAVVAVGEAIGARGVATFGSMGLPVGPDPVASLMPADRGEVRSWGLGIAAGLVAPAGPRPDARHPRDGPAG